MVGLSSPPPRRLLNGAFSNEQQLVWQTGLEFFSARRARVRVKLLADLPLVLCVNAEPPQGDWLGRARGEALTGLQRSSVVEVKHAAVRVVWVSHDCARVAGDVAEEDLGVVEYAEDVVGNVVTAEVAAELQVVLALGPGEIVDELILRDVTSLGKVEGVARDSLDRPG